MGKTQDRSAEVKKYLILMTLITLLGFAVRINNLGSDSLWFDEIITLDSARQDINSILTAQSLDRPPGYYALEHYAIGLWGSNEFGLRLPSALAGSLAIPLLYLLGRLIVNRRIGVLAAAWLAVSPFYLRYSQEARGYSILSAFALVGSVCLLIALRQNRRRWWIAFGIITALNAYNLFGAFLVLSTQIVFVGLWLLTEHLVRRLTWRQVFDVILGLILAGLVGGILYLPYLQSTLQGILSNIGPHGNHAQWYGTPLVDWANAAYLAFGYYTASGAAVLGGLGLIGLIDAIRRRQLQPLVWLLCGIVLPVLLVNLAGVSRAPLPKYIIFILPTYILAASMGVSTLVNLFIERSIGRMKFKPSAVFAAATLSVILLSLPSVAEEYVYTEEDWKSIVNYLKSYAQAGDVFVPLTIDAPDGFNQGVPGLAHYLPQAFSSYYLLFGKHLTDPSVNDLKGVTSSFGQVWFIVVNRNGPVQFDDPTLEVIPFRASTYLVHSLATDQPPIEEMITIYQKIIPKALSPAPQCYLWLDLATLELQIDQPDQAYQAALNFRTPCPQSDGIRQVIYHKLLTHYQLTQQTDQVMDLAQKLLLLDQKDPAALQAVSVFDLRAMFASASPNLSVVSSPARPIQIQRFTMPQSGDWGDAVVMQTPARLIYHLTLPANPVEFQARIAMAPESWDWGGNGSVFQLQVQDQSGNQAALYQRYVSNDDSDRDWHEVSVPLSQYAGQPITLTLMTDPGPGGDTTGDWAAWDSPRIIYAAP